MGFEQSEHVQGPVYIINLYMQSLRDLTIIADVKEKKKEI